MSIASELFPVEEEWCGTEAWMAGDAAVKNMRYLMYSGFSDEEALKLTMVGERLERSQCNNFIIALATANGGFDGPESVNIIV